MDDSPEPHLFRYAQTPNQLSNKSIEWVVDGMFPKHSVSIVCGREGIGKGVNALLSVAVIIKGGLFLGHKANPVPHVLYVDMENPEAVVRDRLARLGLLESENLRIWGQWNETPPPTKFDNPLYLEYALKTGGFIFFDSLVDFCNGGDENSAAEMNDALTKARLLARHCGGVHIQHHSDKYGKSGWRGSTAIPAAADMAFEITLSALL
jgi:RecA-family ATPase